MDGEEDGPGLGRYRHHIIRLRIPRHATQTHSIPHTPVIILHSPSTRAPWTRRDNAWFQVWPNNPLRRDILRTEKSTSGAGDVEFVRAVPALGRERGFGGVEKELAFILGVSLGH